MLRADSFFRVAVGSLSAQIVAPTIGSALMQWSPWLPLISGICVVILGASFTTFIPETMHLQKHIKPVPHTISPTISSADDSLSATFKRRFEAALAGLKHSTSLVRSTPVLLLLFTFLVHYMIQTIDDISLQYISKRFSWPLYRTGFVLSLRAAVNVLLLLIILPGISHLLTSPPSTLTRILNMHSHTGPGKDLLLARISAVLLVVGAFIMALGPTISLSVTGLVVLTLGSGFNALCRSLITPLVDAQHMARLYAIISVVDTLGGFAAQPLLAGLLTLGIKLGGGWLGLPYAGVGVLCFSAGVAVFCLRMPGSEVKVAEGGEGGEGGDTGNSMDGRDEEVGLVGKAGGESVLVAESVEQMGVRAEGPVANTGQEVIY